MLERISIYKNNNLNKPMRRRLARGGARVSKSATASTTVSVSGKARAGSSSGSSRRGRRRKRVTNPDAC